MLNNSLRSMKRKIQAGSTLIEVLVTVVIMTIGLLSLAGMQAFSITANQNATNRSLASALAIDYADMLRANPTGFSAGSYDKAAVAFDKDLVSVVTPINICVYPLCTPTTLAAYEKELIAARVKATLKAGTFALVRTGDITREANLWIIWLEQNNSGATANNATFDNCPATVAASTPLPRCFYMRVML
jgi:type IV pilus assembly protein PilV